MWKWISLIAVVISNLSFMFYFFTGYYSENFLRLREKISVIAGKFERRTFTFPRPVLILFMRFLFLVRNPLAVYLGIKKYEPRKFIFYNFAGSIIWITVWFAVFYSARLGMYKILQEYSRTLHIVYIVFLISWIIYSVKWEKLGMLIFKKK